jgi:hypothetical protein
MIIRALDSNGDWTYGKGQNNYNSGNAAIAEDIQTRLASFLGDCFFDTGAGIDWFNLLGAKDQIAINLAVSAVILNTSNVTGILQLSIVLNSGTRAIVIQYQVVTTYSQITGTFQYDLNGSS